MDKFPSIESFAHVRKSVLRYAALREADGYVPRPVFYRAKVKLHGCNVGVRIGPDGSISPQSRNRVLSIGNDQFGFAMWVVQNKHLFVSDSLRNTTVFGEWAGPGIQNGVACCNIPEKSFFPFMIRDNKSLDDDEIEEDYLQTMASHCPEVIASCLGGDVEHLAKSNVYVLPWYGPEFEINFLDSTDCQRIVDEINDLVAEVEREDPFIKETFGVSGIGEGLVFYPEHGFSRLAFKAKGEKHQVKKTKSKAPVEIDVEVFGKVRDFADAFVTPARLEQIAGEVCGEVLDFNPKLTGKFIGAVCKDVEKESVDELIASGLPWREVSHAVSARAREWWLMKCQEI